MELFYVAKKSVQNGIAE